MSRRNSKVYDQPFVDSVGPDGIPSVRVEDNSNRSDARAGLAGPISANISRIMAVLGKGGIGFLLVIAAVSYLLGGSWLAGLSQLLGFMFIFSLAFCLCCGLFVWWGVWGRGKVGLTRNKIVVVYGICTASQLITLVLDQIIDLGPLEFLPMNLSFYAIFGLSLLSLFSVCVHDKGVAAVFSNESSMFTGLVVLLNICMAALFDHTLYQLMYGQLVHTSCFFGLSLSLLPMNMRLRYTFSRLQRFLSGRDSTTNPNLKVPSRFGPGRKVSNISDHPRHSVSSQSSLGSSLPASYLGGASGFDTDTLNETHGIIGDLLIQESTISNKGVESLRKVQQLLAPKVSRSAPYSPRLTVENRVSDDADSLISLSSATNMASSGPRNRSSVSHGRVSSTRFSTVTTATGLPVISSGPQERKRSLAPRDIRARISTAERPSVHKKYSRHGSITSKDFPLASHNSSVSDVSDLSISEGEVGPPDTGTPPPIEVDRQPMASERPQMSPLRTNSSLSLKPIAENGSESGVRSLDLSSTQVVSSDVDNMTPKQQQVVGVKHYSNTKRGSFVMFSQYTQPDMDYSMDEYEDDSIEALEHVAEWDFPIFDLEASSDGHILSQIANKLFDEAGLLETFQIPRREFLNYFRALEANYGTNSYHNKTHAADVLHATSYLLFEQIPEFSYEMAPSERPWKGHQRRQGSGGHIASAFSILEVFACYMASAMHDFDHPGRTNAFLVATKSSLAVLYNDRSVLENHHAAASWEVLTTVPEHNFLANLDAAEMKRFRFLIIECILATDLKLHFDIVREFKAKFNPEEGESIDWSSEVDRLLVMKMIIKMADINTPTKSVDLHRKWTVRITDEFFQQHDDEKRLELPQTIMMDRNEPDKLPTIQISFIQHLVSPLFTACAEAGIIPADVESVQAEKEGEEGDKEQSDTSLTKPLSDEEDSMGDDDVMEDELTEADIQPVRKVVSIILTNLQMNFDSWHADETAILERQKRDVMNRANGSIEEEEEEEENVELSEQLVAVTEEEDPES